MTRHILLAAVFVLAGASDWELTGRDALGEVRERICAKDRESCKIAIEAIGKGWFRGEVARSWRWRCEPTPGCFSIESECIVNFNCGGRR